MTKTLKWLGGGIAAALLLGLAGLFSGDLAEAQSPEFPGARFVGTVSIDGEGAMAGTSVTAMVDGAECGSATVTTGASGSRYAINVPSSCAGDGDSVSFRIGMYDAAETGTWDNTQLNQLDLSYTTPPPPPPPAECPDGYARADDGMASEDSGDMGPAEPEAMQNGDEPAEPMEGEDGPAEPGMDGDDAGMDGDDAGMDGDGDMEIPEGCEPIEEEEAPDAGETGTGLASASTTTSLAALLGLTALALTLATATYARRRR